MDQARKRGRVHAPIVESSGVDFGFSTEVKVRFAETDAQGIAHHAVYLVWFEVARIEYLARFRGGYPELQAEGIEALTLDASVTYRAPARFDDLLVIRTRCGELRGARFRFEYRVERGGEVIAEGSTRHACADAGTLRPTRVPAWLVDQISRAEPALSS
jgi:acyl-CoA thioester hydrolase